MVRDRNRGRFRDRDSSSFGDRDSSDRPPRNDRPRSGGFSRDNSRGSRYSGDRDSYQPRRDSQSRDSYPSRGSNRPRDSNRDSYPSRGDRPRDSFSSNRDNDRPRDSFSPRNNERRRDSFSPRNTDRQRDSFRQPSDDTEQKFSSSKPSFQKQPRRDAIPVDSMNRRELFMKKAKFSVAEAYKSRDMLLSGVTKTVVDLDEAINLLSERLEHWYSVYFPEFRTDDKLKFAKFVLVFDKKNISQSDLESILGPKKASEVVASSSTSMGADLPPGDLDELRTLARLIVNLADAREQFEKYQSSLAMEICPNLSTLAGPDIAAKLLSHVGSLKRLSILPSSTLQVLGAENSLFKHLKNRRIPPPKHGIIFQNPKISASPRGVRGKIARALSNKMALALKADAYTKRDLSVSLKEDFESRVAKIMEDFSREKSKRKGGEF